MTFQILRLEHVNVTTPEDLEAQVVSWYESCLGLTPFDKPDGTSSTGAWFKVGDQEVHVTRDEHNPPKVAHFCLITDDLDDVIERLRSADCHIEQAAEIPGRRRFFTRDPAGNRVEIASLEES
ncbi:MAG: VOC family protein [Actinomycetota bacterium]